VACTAAGSLFSQFICSTLSCAVLVVVAAAAATQWTDGLEERWCRSADAFRSAIICLGMADCRWNETRLMKEAQNQSRRYNSYNRVP